MKSKWDSVRPQAIALRKQGNSIQSICEELEIPLSTVSTWLRTVSYTSEDMQKIEFQREIDMQKARAKAGEWHRAGKVQRLLIAAEQAKNVLDKISDQDDESLELALAFLYLGEGSKNENTSLGSSNPNILKFYIASVQHLYGVLSEKIKCYLHLRADQDDLELKRYWSNELNIPLENFGKTSFDKRTQGRPTYMDYKGVCTVECGRVEIQRRLMYIANGYCDRVASKIRAVSSFG